MLGPDPHWYRMTEFDQAVFDRLVPKSHPLVAAIRQIDWEALRPLVERFYSATMGQPAIDPVRILKFEFLRYYHGLSDRQVMARAECDLSYRCFLQVGCEFRMPDPTVLCRFRGRLGEKGFQHVFDQVIAQARKAGLVKDRLRLKDASHVIASIAVPTTLTLIAQIRDRLLETAESFDAEGAAGHRLEAELVRDRTKNERDEMRLEARVRHLEDVLEWAQSLEEPQGAPPDAPRTATRKDAAWKRLCETRALAQKILHDHEHPEQGGRTLSVADPEARRGKHGAFYDGYVLDILLDADSGLITQVHVLPAGGDEARDAVELIRAEEAAHGNDIQNLSIDGAGFHGEMLRTLESDLGVTTYVPPKAEPASGLFPTSAFTFTPEGNAVTCPAGKTSRYRQRNQAGTGTLFRFDRATCDGCPLVAQCVAKPGQGAFGRTVTKNDYEAEYRRCRERAQTAAYAAIRREHPAVERKLNEVLNHQRGRSARYRTRAKVQVQELMTCLVVNVKRMMALFGKVKAAAG